MRFPWQKPEVRESVPFTDAVVAALEAGIAGSTARATATAALEAAAGVVSRGFAAAEVENAPPMAVDALTPETLALIGRNLIRRGEDIHVIELTGDKLRLFPAGSWDVRGGHDPDEWFVLADLFGPSGNITRFVPHSQTLHCRYAVDAARPWFGIGPLGWAALSGKLHAGAVAALERDMNAASAYPVPMPSDSENEEDSEAEEKLAKLRAAIHRAKGKSVFVGTTRGAFGADRRDAPARDWKQERLGPEPPTGLSSVHDSSALSVLAACGVDPLMTGLSRGDGTALREAYRRFERLTLAPLARIVTTELRDKMDAPNLTLTFNSLRASDFAGIARSFKAMVEAGVSTDAASAILDIDI